MHEISLHFLHCTNDSVTRVNDSSRLASRFMVTRTRVEWRWEKWWLESARVPFFLQNDSNRVTVNDSRLESGSSVTVNDSILESKSKSLSSWWINPVCLHTKK